MLVEQRIGAKGGYTRITGFTAENVDKINEDLGNGGSVALKQGVYSATAVGEVSGKKDVWKIQQFLISTPEGIVRQGVSTNKVIAPGTELMVSVPAQGLPQVVAGSNAVAAVPAAIDGVVVTAS